MSESARVLVVDDEPSLVDAVSTALRYAGFETVGAADGEEALAAADHGDFDAIVLDIMMPETDGVDVCRILRDRGVEAPVLFLTARADVTDKVTALRAGGDDYVVKPFSLPEVVARVEAMTRRYRGRRSQPSVVQFADLEVYPEAHRVLRNGTEIVLTATEFRLLRYFLANPGITLSKMQIVAAVWPLDFDGPATIVETYVGYLRRKLDAHGPPLIHTVRLVGYVLRSADT